MAKNNLLDDILQSSEEESKFAEEDKTLAPLLDEISLIVDDEIRSFVRRVLLAAPPSFWVAPGAVHPEIHPLDEYQKGGLVLHTKRVVRCVWLLGESQGRQQTEIDILYAAALIHDILKSDEEGRVDFMHAYTMDALIDEIAIADHILNEQETEVNRSTIKGLYGYPEIYMSIMRLVRCHKGIASIVPETIPVTTIEWLFVHANDVAKNLDLLLQGPELYVKDIEGNINEEEVAEG